MAHTYIAYDSQKRLVQGTLSIRGKEQAKEILAQAGYSVIAIKRVRWEWVERLLAFFERPVSTKAMISFSRNLTRYLESGLSVNHALDLLHNRISDKSMQNIIGGLSKELRDGNSLAHAMSLYSRTFSQIYVRLIQLGEETGTLLTVLKRFTTELQKQHELKRKAVRALTYPLIVMTVAIAVGALFVLLIMPKMALLLESLDTELPFTTRLVLATADVSTKYGPAASSALAILGITLIMLARTKRGRDIRDWAVLKPPTYGRLVLYTEIAKLTRNMSLLLGGGLRLSETLALLEPASSNPAFPRSTQVVVTRHDGERAMFIRL